MTTVTSTLQAKQLAPGLTVNDLAASIDFYEKLGFAIGERWEHEGTLLGVMMIAGQGALGLSQDDWKKGKDRVKGLGMSLYVSTSQDVDDLANRAMSEGLTLDSGPEDYPWGGRGFAITDPDGFKLTIARDE